MSTSTVRSIIRATLACAVLVTLISGAVMWTEGYRVYVVHTGSMTPTYRPGDIVIDRPAQHRYHAGEVITFRHSAQTTDVVTHRVTDITPTGLIHTKGDANRTADVWDIRHDQVRGSVAMSVPLIGYLLVFLHQPAGVASMALAALAIALLCRLFFATTETDAHRDPAGATGTSALLTA
jgi:signal peptidase I